MPLNRRQFLKTSIRGAAAVGAASVAVGDSLTDSSGRFSLPGLYAAETSPKKASKYIDVHTHIGTTWNGNKELTADDLLRWMDEHDVEKSVLLPLTSPESSSFLLLTEPALAAAKAHPDRFVAFCSIDPRCHRQVR